MGSKNVEMAKKLRASRVSCKELMIILPKNEFEIMLDFICGTISIRDNSYC